MPKSHMFALSLVVGILASSVCSVSMAQTSTPASANADIVKMIQAGLPENTIVNKIREGAGHWDTSVDSLIALKKAGATEAELTALTNTSYPQVANEQQETALAPVEPIEVFGAQLLRTRNGDPYLKFQSSRPELFPNGLESNTAYLVSYKGQVAVLIPAVAIQESDCSVFNMLFQRNQLVIDQYLFGACNLLDGPSQAPLQNGLYEFRNEGLKFDRGKTYGMMADPPMRNLGLSFDRITFGEVNKKIVKADVLFGIFPYTFAEFHATEMRAALFESFVEQLTNNFDATVSEFERAAAITDPVAQLSSHTRYTPITINEANNYKRILEQRWKETHQGNGGNGWLSALNAMQGAANMQQAVQDAKVADLTHNSAGQLRAASNAATAEMQTLGAVSGDTTPIQPLAPAVLSQTQPTLPQPTPNAVASTPQKAQSGFKFQVSHGQPESKAVASNTGSVPAAANSQPRANPNPGGVPSGVSTGTAPPPTASTSAPLNRASRSPSGNRCKRTSPLGYR